MADLKRRFDEEMRHLLGAGREFARECPALAQALSIDDVARRHPYLERLFESFAFLVARTRTDLEEADDDTAGEVLDLIAYGLEIPLPSVSIVEFLPSAETSGTAEQVNEGSEIRAWATGHSSQVRTTVVGNCHIEHLRVDSARLSAGSEGHASLEFVLTSVVPVGVVRWPSELAIFLGKDPGIAWTLRHLLLRRVHSVEVIGGGGAPPPRFSPFTAPGYSRFDSPACAPLLDLRDFLCAEERFRFVSLMGLDSTVPNGATSVRIRVRFEGVLPRDLEPRVDKSSLRLNCVPVVNAYLQECEPLLVDASRSSYPLVPREEPDKEVLDLAGLRGASQSDPTRTHDFVRSWELRHVGLRAQERGSVRLRRRSNRSGGSRTSFVISHPDPDFFFPDEFLAGDVWCCDGDLLSDKIRPQDLSEPGPGIPGGLGACGLTKPSQVFRPPSGPGFRWCILSHFQRSFRDLLDADSLKETLRALLWDPRGIHRHLIDGIRLVESVPGYRLSSGVPCPSWEIRVVWEGPDVKSDSWDHLGRLDAFAAGLFGLFHSRTPPGVESWLSMCVEPCGVRLEQGK